MQVYICTGDWGYFSTLLLQLHGISESFLIKAVLKLVNSQRADTYTIDIGALSMEDFLTNKCLFACPKPSAYCLSLSQVDGSTPEKASDGPDGSWYPSSPDKGVLCPTGLSFDKHAPTVIVCSPTALSGPLNVQQSTLVVFPLSECGCMGAFGPSGLRLSLLESSLLGFMMSQRLLHQVNSKGGH
ncbi:hypothetical protein BJY00DRAFT_48380 [Aspergillus carlsbadensis]|nr:hypothetical protein BJY00DRAFT_48380 [Aspergillus carlsbadensis]